MAYSKYFVPEIWANKVERTLEDNLIAKKICSTEYSGQIKKAGDTVHFNGLGDPTVNTYDGSSITYEALADTQVNLVVDQAKYFAFKVGDIEKAQANVDLKGSQAARAGYILAKQMDSFVLGKYADAGIQVTGATDSAIVITTANILSNVGKIAQKLMEANVSETDMFMALPPWMKVKMELAGIKFSINEGINGTGGMAYTKDLGFDVYITNQVVNQGTASVPKSRILAGSYSSIVFAEQINDVEDLRLESTFDTAVRGLAVYGGKVVRPERLASAYFEYADETTI